MDFKSLAKLTRIEHSFMLVVAVLAGELISGRLPALVPLLLSFITPIFISMGSFAINDYFDVESDRLNKRYDRPIVSGKITKKEALFVASASFATGMIASAFINAYAFIIAVVFGLLAILYSYRLKDLLLLGNIDIALSMAIPFIYGNFVVSSSLTPNIILISFVVFLSGLAREIHGMIRDYEGDKKARKTKNLIRYFGDKKSAYMAFVLYMEAIAISIFMFFYEKPFLFNIAYIAPILVVDSMLIYVSYAYLFKKGVSFYRFTRNLSLGAMALAIFAYLVAAIAYIPV